MCDCVYEQYQLSAKSDKQIIEKYDLEQLFEKYVKQLYEDRKLSKQVNEQLFQATYQPLKTAAKEGFGQVVSKVEYGTPNFEMLKNLQHNAGVFTAFKNHAMVKEVAALLKDSDGNLKNFYQFKEDALKIDNKYRITWLRTEYDTAVRTARMAAQWQSIQENRKYYPNLEYVRTRSTNPNDDHLKLVGTVLPIDDPFWNIWYPPNKWNCKCSVKQTDKEPTDAPEILPEIDKNFAFHPGKTGQLFNIKNTEYIKSVPAALQPKLIKEAKKTVNNDIIAELEEMQIYKSKSGGKVTAHPLAINNSDFDDNLSVARSLANKGHRLQMLPDIENQELRKTWMPKGVKGNKNPDFFIDDEFAMDLKVLRSNKKSTVDDAISRCHEQCDNLMIDVPNSNPLEWQDLLSYSKRKLSHDAYSDFGKVWIRFKGEWHFLTRNDIIEGNYKSPGTP